ncbi:hypothetical protein [Lentimonas sp. CC4]|uniref:hypothetical protein n=1 Tax=Lentimonas sp. CC4 TaxID=2676099 RepID=UPI001A7F0D48|nr:hypothetical protein [Lentimonas sp. CC4]
MSPLRGLRKQSPYDVTVVDLASASSLPWLPIQDWLSRLLRRTKATYDFSTEMLDLELTET